MTRLTVGPNPQIGDNAEIQVHGRALNTIHKSGKFGEFTTLKTAIQNCHHTVNHCGIQPKRYFTSTLKAVPPLLLCR